MSHIQPSLLAYEVYELFDGLIVFLAECQNEPGCVWHLNRHPDNKGKLGLWRRLLLLFCWRLGLGLELERLGGARLRDYGSHSSLILVNLYQTSNHA